MYEDATLKMQKHMTIHLLSNSNRPLGHFKTKRYMDKMMKAYASVEPNVWLKNLGPCDLHVY